MELLVRRPKLHALTAPESNVGWLELTTPRVAPSHHHYHTLAASARSRHVERPCRGSVRRWFRLESCRRREAIPGCTV